MASASKGFEKVLANLEKARRDAAGALGAAVYQKGMAIITDAKRYTPVDTGRLRASGYVSPPESVYVPRVTAGFGTDYALPVHERVEVFHEVGQPLFLKRAVDEHTAGYAKWIADQAKENLEKGITVARSSGLPKSKEAGEAAGEAAAKRSIRIKKKEKSIKLRAKKAAKREKIKQASEKKKARLAAKRERKIAAKEKAAGIRARKAARKVAAKQKAADKALRAKARAAKAKAKATEKVKAKVRGRLNTNLKKLGWNK